MDLDQLLYINVQRFRGGLVFKAHRILYHSTVDSRVIKKKREGVVIKQKTGYAHLGSASEQRGNEIGSLGTCSPETCSRRRAKRGQLEKCQGHLPERQGQNLAVTVLRMPCSLAKEQRSYGFISHKVFFKVVLQKSTPPQIRQLIIYYY